MAAAHAIFARVSPEQKQALVRGLGRRGRYIAMVGDGVNDVPAMKAARIAVALGSGSQIARGVSDIVLVSDDFGAIPTASRGPADPREPPPRGEAVRRQVGVRGDADPDGGDRRRGLPLLPRHLSLAAPCTVGIPAFALALAPSTGRPPKPKFIRDLLRFSVPGGVVSALAVIVDVRRHALAPALRRATGSHGRAVVLVLAGLYLVLLLEDEAMRSSRVRARRCWCWSAGCSPRSSPSS